MSWIHEWLSRFRFKWYPLLIGTLGFSRGLNTPFWKCILCDPKVSSLYRSVLNVTECRYTLMQWQIAITPFSIKVYLDTSISCLANICSQTGPAAAPSQNAGQTRQLLMGAPSLPECRPALGTASHQLQPGWAKSVCLPASNRHM